MKYGDAENPLLLSCRSGARQSMPGMMETVLNVGLCSKTIPGLIKKTKQRPLRVRRLSPPDHDVFRCGHGKGRGHRACRRQGHPHAARAHHGQDEEVEKIRHRHRHDGRRPQETLQKIQGKNRRSPGPRIPRRSARAALGAIGAVFKSWEGKRSVSYRKIEGIPGNWGTACNVQSMVFGNLGNTSATGVAFSRNPATGENKFYGEWLINAQGEDVVAGIRTPNPLNEGTKNPQNQHLSSLQTEWPELYKQLDDIRTNLEKHYKDMQDIEFTIQEGKLYMLQCRNGKRTGTAALNMAMDMLEEGLIDEKTAVMRVQPAQLDELLHPIINPESEKKATAFLTGLPAGPGGACGKIVFTSVDAVAKARR